SAVLPLRARRWQSGPVSAAPRDSVRHLPHGTHPPWIDWHALAQSRDTTAACRRRPGLYAAAVHTTPGASSRSDAARGRVRSRTRAGDSPRRGRGQDARLPCRRVVAPAPPRTMDLSIVILNYNTRDHLRACLRALQAEGSTSLAGGPIGC